MNNKILETQLQQGRLVDPDDFPRVVLINRGKPPAMPGDSQSLTIPGIFEKFPKCDLPQC